MDVAANIAQLIGFLPTAGPFVALMLLAWWLSLERKERIAAQADATAMRDKRVAEMKETTEALAELGEATRSCLKEHDQHVDRVVSMLRQPYIQGER